jgi:hypothetical protein
MDHVHDRVDLPRTTRGTPSRAIVDACVRRASRGPSRLVEHLLPPRPLAALLIAAVLALGGIAHAWHHVADRDCAGAAGPHPCTQCSMLHGAAIVAVAVTVVAQAPAAPGTIPLRVHAAPSRIARVTCAPRAPPIG